MAASTPHIQVEIFDEGTVVSFVDERIVEESLIEAIGQQLLNLVEKQGHTNLVLDFSKVKFLASAMLAKLFTLRRRVDQAKGKIHLCGIDRDLRVVFKFAPKGAFEIFDDEQDALEAF